MTTSGRAQVSLVDLVISQGADQTYRFRYRSGGVPVDLTGWSARAEVRDRTRRTVWIPLLSPTLIQLGADGRIAVTIPHELTTGPDWTGRDVGVWDLVLTDPSGKRMRLLSGRVTVSQAVTGG